MIDLDADSVPTLRSAIVLIQSTITNRYDDEPAAVPAGTLPVESLFGRAPPPPSIAAAEDGPVVGFHPAHYTSPPSVAAVPMPPAVGYAAPVYAMVDVPPPPPSAAAEGDDSAGMPWDERIHQSTRKFNKDGTWANRRGLDKGVLAAVTAEIKFNRNQAARGGTPPAAGAPLPVAPPPPPGIPAIPDAPPPPPALPQATAPAVPAVNPITGFRELMQKVTQNTAAGRLTQAHVDAALATVNLPPRQLIALVNLPNLIPDVSAYLDAVLAAGG